MRNGKIDLRRNRLIALLWLITVLCSFAVADADNPVADPKAVVVSGDARFTILTPELVRMEWTPGAKFEDHASLVFLNRRLAVPSYTTRNEGRWLVIRTSSLELRYRKGTGRFTADNLSVTLQLNGKTITWNPATPDDGNLQGTTRTLDGVNGAVALEPGLLSRNGWTVVDDTKRLLFDNSDWPWVSTRPEEERQDLYFFGYGHNYKKALADFTKVAGRIPLPPRFVFGAWWSRYWAYTDKELMELVADFRAHDVPLDVLVIDMDWHLDASYLASIGEKDQSGHSLGWTGYTWNRNYFPDPQKFLGWAHDQGLKTTVNLHPASGVQPFEEQYPEMARAMGIDPATRQYVKFDIANRKFADNYFNILHHPLQNQGVDFFWLDWQQENTTGVPGLNPTFWLNYLHSTDMERGGKRPLIYHRWGGLGNHRYQIGFSGDTISTWESLAFQPYFTATASNVGYGYWSHDLGGHMPGKVDGELYTRWLQFGVFSPVLRIHSTKNPEADRRPWAFAPKYAEAMHKAIELRYALIPYIYTAARQAYDTGISLMRPMYYDYPESAEAYKYTGQYMFGDSMLVAPVTTALNPLHQLSPKAVWIPDGEWIEWTTGNHIKGPIALERNYPLDEIPVFLKAGAIIPMQPKMRFSNEKPVDPLILTVFPGPASSAEIYEDAGTSLGYKGSEFSRTTVSTERPDPTTFKLRISPTLGQYPGMPEARAIEVRLFSSWPPDSITFNGVGIPHSSDDGTPGWTYDGDTLTTIIRLPKTPATKPAELSVRISASNATNLALLDGALGRLARMRRIFHDVNNTGPVSLLRVATLGRRIELEPDSALEELSALPSAQNTAVEDLRKSNPDAWRITWSLVVAESMDKVSQ